MIANPCGLFSKYIFYDKYVISKLKNKTYEDLTLIDNKIIWD